MPMKCPARGGACAAMQSPASYQGFRMGFYVILTDAPAGPRAFDFINVHPDLARQTPRVREPAGTGARCSVPATLPNMLGIENAAGCGRG